MADEDPWLTLSEVVCLVPVAASHNDLASEINDG